MFGAWQGRAIARGAPHNFHGGHDCEHFDSHSVKILVAGMGGGFGLGRYEALLLSALQRIADIDDMELRSVWRGWHASYLNMPAAYTRDDPQRTARWQFALQVLLNAVGYRPDVVVFTIPNLAPLGLALPALQPSARVIVCTHGIEIWSQLPVARRVALRRANRVVASARYNADRIRVVQGVRPERIVLIPLALSPSWGRDGHPAARAKDSDRHVRLLSVARLDAGERYKGIDTVIRALPDLQLQVPSITYRVVGEGTDLQRLQRLANDCGVADAVQFIGAVDHRNLLREYQRCDVFVLPSTGEGFGLVFLEAMSFAKPVVAVAAGGPIDIVEDGMTGRLVESPDNIAAALLELLLNREQAKEMGTRGRTRLEAAFSFERYVERWRQTLHTVLAEKR
jgi:phosphatidylinositol alpha-1,6-mannosyltransferase